MDFGKQLKQARQASGLSQQDVAQALGIDKTTYSGYETGRRQPDLSRLQKLARRLNVSADQLLGLDPAAVSPEEWQALQKYRLLDLHGRELVSLVLQKEYDRMTAPQAVLDQSRGGWVTYINCYDLAVSAGPGEPWADAGYKTRLEIPEAQVPQQAHFCVRVNGDSMEPAYRDGDIVFVQRLDGTVQEGEVGIFFLNGEGYIKRLAPGALVCLNPRYAPIPLHDFDDLRCQGRVLGKLEN